MGDTSLQVLATADPPDHEAHRKMLAPLFTPKKLALLEADVRRTAELHIDGAIKKGSVEFMSEVANLVPITIINKLIGFKNANLDYLLQAAFDSTAVVGGALSETELVEIGLRAAEVFNWVSAQMATASTSDDSVLSALKSFVNNGQLDIQCAVGMVHLLLSAGGESTTSLIGNAIRLLAEDTSLQETLRQHPVQIANFLEEVLRFEAPFRSHIRSVPRDTALGSVPIPAGALVLLFWAAGNRDPKVFKEPEKFDVNRPRKHMTFGRGIHMCIGAPLARLEAKIVLEELLQRTTSFTLIAGKPPQWVESLQVRRYAELPISLEPKKT
jgi:cytochrome P450